MGDINAEEAGEIHYWEPLGAILGASWAHLGSSWAPKRPQEGAQDEPKTNPKRHDFLDDFLTRFWSDLRGTLFAI